MATRKIIAPSAGYEGLRNRAVLREADLRDLLFETTQKNRPRDLNHLPKHHFGSTPHLEAQLAENDGFRPRIKTGSASDAAPTRARFEIMRRNAGDLVMVTAIRRDLNGMRLKDKATAEAWREGHEFMLNVIAPQALAFSGFLQAGAQGGQLHDHTVIPLLFLTADLQVFALTAPSGAGGGAIHPESGLQLVVLGDTPTDRAKVASYLSRDPDGRFDLPDDHPDYLQAHEDAILRKQSGTRSPRLVSARLPASWR